MHDLALVILGTGSKDPDAEKLANLVVEHVESARRAPKPDGALLDVMGKAEVRIRETLARLAPRGTQVTPDLLTKVNREVVKIVKEELVESGMSEGMAAGLAAVLAAAMRVTPKGM
jgi:hypothetical protein